MHHLMVRPPSRKTLGRAGRATRFAPGKIEVGGTAGSAVVRNCSDAPVKGHGRMARRLTTFLNCGRRRESFS